MNYDAQTSWANKVNILGRLENEQNYFSIYCFSSHFHFSLVGEAKKKYGQNIQIDWQYLLWTHLNTLRWSILFTFFSWYFCWNSLQSAFSYEQPKSFEKHFVVRSFEKTFLVLYKFFVFNSNLCWQIRNKSRIQIKSFSIPHTEWSLTTSTTFISH